ncbi:energy transducer TonB [Myxococcota bacterium]|nr:energy transducer TonB [Myxococcota bacterium]
MGRYPVRHLVLASVLSAAWCACSQKPPPEARDDFTLDAALPALVPLQLDEFFLGNLAALADRVPRRPELAEAYGRFALGGLAAAMIDQHTALPRLLGADPREPSAVPRFLRQVAQKVAGATPDLAGATEALAAAWGTEGDVSPALAFAKGSHPAAPAFRALLAARLLAALGGVADSPEGERGLAFQQAFPTLPTAPTNDITRTAFPAGLALLSDLLKAGAGPEQGLGRIFATLRQQADDRLGNRVFPLPLPSGQAARPGAVQAGLPGPYTPLLLWVVSPDGASAGFRPAIRWSPEGPSQALPPEDAASRARFPAEALGARSLQVSPEAREAFQALARASAELEPMAWPNQAGIGILSGERGDRGLPVLVDLRGDPPARILQGALAVLSQAGFTDLRFAAPGTVGRSLAFFHRKPPSLPGIAALAGPRVLVLVGSSSAKVFGPPGAQKVSREGWPEGVQAGSAGQGPLRVEVPWSREEGFRGRLAQVVGLWRERTRAGVPVDVLAASMDLPALAMLDAAQEVFASPGPPFGDLGTWFPGLSCAQGGACPAAIPVIFSDAKPPKEKVQVTVTETRPAGFCDPQAVQRTILGRSGAYRACYEQELQRYGRLEGRLELRFTIEPDGSVSGITVVQNELNRTVEACVIRQVSQLKFPKPDGGVCVIRWPFRFQPGG